jgi:CHAT domain-containing protein/tetratricopeptide (TPR) repeat protein
MKTTGFPSLFACLILMLASFIAVGQKKYDKMLKKADDLYNAGDYAKASKTLQKFKKAVTTKLGQQNNYMPSFYIRDAKTNLALGVLTGFDGTLENAISSAQTNFGDNSTVYAVTMIEVAEIYNEYGNYRIARDYIQKAKDVLTKSNQMTDALKGRISLAEAEAMIGQGFVNSALEVLKSVDNYFASHAVEKETVVENGSIKTKRVDEAELPYRFGDYAKLLTLYGNAYTKKGRISVGGDDSENVDAAFQAEKAWLKGKDKYLGETSLVPVEYRYYYAMALVENGNKNRESSLHFDNILDDLKKRQKPTSALAHNLYLQLLADLLEEDNRSRYSTVKSEYEKVIDKNFPKASLHRINLQSVEFNARLANEKTKNLEQNALGVLNSKTLPKNYKTTLQILEFLYTMALTEQRYTNAETYLNQIADAKKDLCGDNSPEYHLAKIRIANFYMDYTNKIDEAIKIYDESYYKFVSHEIGEQHKDLINILNHLAQYYELTDKYSQASKTLRDALDAATSKYSNDDILFGIELNNIAKLQLKLGEYDDAEKNINAALKIIRDKKSDEYTEQIPALASTLQTQAKLYGIKGLFDDAEDNLERVKKLFKKANLVADELTTARELSGLYIQLGKYSDTDDLLTKLIFDTEKIYGRNSIQLIEPLVDKAKILLAKGDYTEGERVALRANQLAVKSYGEASTKTAPTQKILSDIYYTLGDFDKAEDAITKALASQERQFGRNHIEVAKSLSQLALIKFYKGDNRAAVEKLMLESRSIMEQKLGKENPQYAEILKNVAVLYISEKRYDIAFSSLTQAEAIWRTKTGTKQNINAASIYTLTGDVYYQLKNYKKAEEFYNQAKDLYEKFFSSSHPEYVKVLSKLSKVYYMQKDYKRSKKMVEESLNNYENFIKLYFPALSEREKAKYWNTIRGDFEFYNTLAFSNLEDFKDLTGKVYNYQLLTKALLLSSSIKIRERIQNSTDEDLKAQFNDWQQKKEKLTLALSMSPAQLSENEIDPVSLQQEVERLEKEISERSEIFGQSFENKKITFDDVKKALKPNEVALEMVRYRYFNHTFTDSVIYAGLYLRNEFSKPKAIILKDGKKMETRYFKFYRNAITGKVPDDISYGIFWEPIYKEIGQASAIYLSADGIYNQINMEAIPTPDGKYVIDNSNIVLVSNTKDLYLRKIKTRLSAPENTASMFGNPTFYLTASADQAVASLPGTEKEINQVDFMLKQKGWTTSEYVEKSATEEKVKELNSPKIFHIATHGFYKPTEEVTLEQQIEGNEAVLAQNPLLRTGLLLKGAGDLLEKTNYNYNMDNGILTAYEAMSLNLDKTDLVVLSACETGLGELEAGEGVVGLQRAFLVAGAKVLIMSMFKVDDEATQKLMLKFYQKWLNTGNLRQSFIDAKKELRVEYPEPIYWGAFMMIGLD